MQEGGSGRGEYYAHWNFIISTRGCPSTHPARLPPCHPSRAYACAFVPECTCACVCAPSVRASALARLPVRVRARLCGCWCVHARLFYLRGCGARASLLFGGVRVLRLPVFTWEGLPVLAVPVLCLGCWCCLPGCAGHSGTVLVLLWSVLASLVLHLSWRSDCRRFAHLSPHCSFVLRFSHIVRV